MKKVFVIHFTSENKDSQPVVKTAVADSFAQVGAFVDGLSGVVSISVVNEEVTLL